MNFFKALLVLPPIYHVCKKNLKMRDRNAQENCDILKNKYVIIFKLFEMMMRVERTIRNTASKCLKELLRKE